MNRKAIAITGTVLLLLAIFVSHTLQARKEARQRAREATLRADLAGMRRALQRYEDDRRAKPHALADLVPSYLRAIPADPITGSSSTWRTEVEETVRVDDFTAAATGETRPSIVDVHSGAAGRDSAGRPYSEY